MGIANSVHRARADFFPVPIVHDKNELVLKRRLSENNPVMLILERMWSIEEIDVEFTNCSEIHLSIILFQEAHLGFRGSESRKVAVELYGWAAKSTPIINSQSAHSIVMDRGTKSRTGPTSDLQIPCIVE
jgi:hypothetical protein